MDATHENLDDPTQGTESPRGGSSATAPLPRSEGERAEVPQLVARLVDAADAGDTEMERALSVELARLHASRGTDLDEALRLARRALALGEDAALRAELSGWLSGVGEPALAAAEMMVLAETSETPRARVKAWMRAAVLHARSGNATAARAAIAKATEVDPKDAIPHELAATLAAWSSDAQGSEAAAEAYLRAARLREVVGDSEAAFEDTLRAFETSRGSSAAAQALVDALKARGRAAAADEVLCLHAEALSPKLRVNVHIRRLQEALVAGDLPRALVSAFDAGIEIETDPGSNDEHRSKVDELLARVGMYDLLAARLAVRARGQQTQDAAETYEALARLAGGPLARPERAIDAHLAAASLNPQSMDARRALRDHAEVSGDLEPLVEALVRIATSEASTDTPARIAALHELGELAQGKLGDPLLALWSFGALEQISEEERETVQLSKARVEADAQRAEEEIARLEALASRRGDGLDDAREARVAALRQLAKLYRSKPDHRARWIEVLAALVRAEPLQIDPSRALERVMTRRAGPASREELELYESVLRARLDAALPKRERGRVRRELARLLGSPALDRSIEDIAPLLAGDPAASAELYVFATIDGAQRDRAQALLDLAEPLGPPLKAVLFALAAELLLAAGDPSTALRAAESAISAAPGSARAARALARVAAARSDRESASALERAMGILAPTVELCAELATALDRAGEPSLSFAWTQRWLALTPSSPRAIRELVRRAVSLGDSGRLSEALGWVLAQPEPFAELAAPLLDGLRALFELDTPKAKGVARKALDVFGSKDPVLRRELIMLGDQHGDRGLSIAALERWLATLEEPSTATFLELALRRADAADFDGAARELVRSAVLGGAPDATLEATRDLEKSLASGDKKLSADGRIWFAEAVARSLSDLDGDRRHSEQTLDAWRALGALRWDLAEDYRGSEQALFAACDPVDRFDLYAQDLVELAGPEQAVLAIRERALVLDGAPKRIAKLLTAAARAAAEQGMLEISLDTAALALELDASQPEAVAIAEASARGAEGALVLSRVYDGLAHAAMGIYGQRAAHYRAARQLERRGSIDLALKHAIASFEAVPTEGTSWQLVTRLVETTGDSTDAVRVLERIGQAARPEERNLWLKRAALLTRPTPEGLGIRLDILLRALLSLPESPIVASIEETVVALLARGESADLSSARFERALYATLPKLGGPDGAFVAIRLAGAAARVGLVHAAVISMSRALVADAGHGSFAELMSVTKTLAGDLEATSAFVAAAETSPTRGKETLQLAARLANELGDHAAEGRLRAEVERRDAEERAQRAETFDLDDDDAPAALQVEGGGRSSGVEPENVDAVEVRTFIPAVPSATTETDDPAGDQAVESADPAASPPRTPSAAPDATASVPPERLSLASEPPQSQVGPGAELEAAERLAHGNGNFSYVSEILQQRIALAPTEDARRLLRLRRAALLEQRLNRLADACADLEAILSVSPDDRSALSFLADLYTRTDQSERAAPLWERMSEQVDRPDEERVELALKAIYGHTLAGNPSRALIRLDKIQKALPPEVVAELRVSAARASGDQLGLALALDALSTVKRFESAEEQAQVLFEAATAALSSGDESGALLRLRRSVRLDPKNARATLEALRLEYRARGTGTPREAQAAVDSLATVTEGLPGDLVELHAFLLAEELDVIQGGGAGMRELTHRHAEVGPLPLVALGMAERLARNRSHEQALPLFERALAGDFQGLRSRGRVALAAADSAIQVGSLVLAQTLLDEAQSHPETRSQVDRRRRELLAANDDPTIATKALEDLIGSSTGLARARFLERLAEIRADADPAAALLLYEEALTVGRHDRPLTERVRRAIALLRARDEEAEREATPPAPAAADDANERPSGGFAEVDPSEVSITSVRPAARTSEPRVDERPGGVTSDSEPEMSEAASVEEASLAETSPTASIIDPELTPLVPPVLWKVDSDDESGPEDTGEPERAERSSGPSVEVQAVEDDHAVEDDVPPVHDASVEELLASLEEAPAPEDTAFPSPVPAAAIPVPAAVSGPVTAALVAVESAEPSAPSPMRSAPANGPSVRSSNEQEKPLTSGRAEAQGSDDANTQSAELATAQTSSDAKAQSAELATPAKAAPQVEARADSAPDSVPPPSRMPASRAEAVLWPAIETDREEQLFQELLGGSDDAGEALVRGYGPARTRDILVVRRHQAAHRPGQRAALERLLDASIADKSTAYARSVEHVLSIGTSPPYAPPPLSAQLVEPGLLQRLLFRDLATPATEALALVWESGLYRRDLGAYGLDKAPRIQPGPATPLSSVYAAVQPLFGQRSLYQPRRDGPLRVSVALLSQPALVVEGDVKVVSPEIHYLLASRLAATLPEFAIVAAESDDAVQTLLDAIVAAFGPVHAGSGPASVSAGRGAAIARIGADLWQRVSPRTERRLRAIAEGEPLSLEDVREKTQTAMRRAGLFAAGDLSVALKITLEELGEDPTMLQADRGLERACQFSEIADLVRLATRMEYAEARFFAMAAPAAARRPGAPRTG